MTTVSNRERETMFIEFTTTVIHRIEIGDDGIEGISHSVEVEAGEAAVLGTSALFIIARAGCEAAIKALDANKYTVEQEVDVDDNEDGDDYVTESDTREEAHRGNED